MISSGHIDAKGCLFSLVVEGGITALLVRQEGSGHTEWTHSALGYNDMTTESKSSLEKDCSVVVQNWITNAVRIAKKAILNGHQTPTENTPDEAGQQEVETLTQAYKAKGRWYITVKWKHCAQTTDEPRTHLLRNCTADIRKEINRLVKLSK